MTHLSTGCQCFAIVLNELDNTSIYQSSEISCAVTRALASQKQTFYNFFTRLLYNIYFTFSLKYNIKEAIKIPMHMNYLPQTCVPLFPNMLAAKHIARSLWYNNRE